MSKLEKIIKKTICSSIVGLSLFLIGCHNPHTPTFIVTSYNLKNISNSKPQGRLGAYPSSTSGIEFIDADNLGHHCYRAKSSEKNGIVYTRKAGNIDIYHVRISADWTAFYASETFKHLIQGKKEFTFKSTEPSIYHVKINYSGNWNSIPEDKKQKIFYDISINLGKYFCHKTDIWHEILTWFGYKSTGIFSEFPSAFSWEDTFSDVFGTHIGGKALRALKDEGKTKTYDELVTLILKQEIERLEPLPRDIAREISENLREKWFSGNLPTIVSIKKRNFDIGADEGYIAPLIPPIPGEKIMQSEPLKDYPVPNLDFLSKYGFSLELKVEPREWEKGKILKIVGQEKYISPEEHFPKIIEAIKKEAIKLYGENVDKPTLD